MGIVLKINNKSIKIDSSKIIGIMGSNYEKFIDAFIGNIFYVKRNFKFYGKKVLDELSFGKEYQKIIKEYELSDDFINKKISDLSLCERRYLAYILAFSSKSNIIVIDDVYLYLDYFYKKKIKYYLKKIINTSKKTIIIGSNKSDDIYDICDSVLLINKNNYYYDNVLNVFTNKKVLNEYDIICPMIIYFVNLCHEKGINIHYTNDVRDLIKEVYKNV